MTSKFRKHIEHATGVFRCGRGQTAIEYALVAVFITVVLIFAFRSVHIECGISSAASQLQNTMENPPNP